MGFLGPYQIFTIDGIETVDRVDDWEKQAVSINAGLAQARSGAVTDAKAYADGEFATDRGRLNLIEAKDLAQDTAIGDTLTAARAYTDALETEIRDELATSHIALDVDGVPYYSIGSKTVQVHQDTDGVLYFEAA